MKLKAALDSEVMMKLLVAEHSAAENKSAGNHFHYSMKTESIPKTKDGEFVVCLIY